MNPDIQMLAPSERIQGLADKAAEKIRGGYSAPHAANSVLKELELGAEEREKLFYEVLCELSRRSRMRRKKNKINFVKRLKETLHEERVREATRLAFERGDHLLSDP